MHKYYRLENLIGQGKYGSVFLAFHKETEKKRAIKKAQLAKQSKKKQKQAASVVNSDKDDLLDVGQVLAEVRIKEHNYWASLFVVQRMIV